MFQCSECDKKYIKQTLLNRHLQNHRKSRQYTCQICHVSFYRRDLLSRHSKIHGSQTPSSLVNSTAHGTRLQTHEPRGRQRCHTACISCREARAKCDGHQPCLTCMNSKKMCEYSRKINRISEAPRNREYSTSPFEPQQSNSTDTSSSQSLAEASQPEGSSIQPCDHSPMTLDTGIENNGFLPTSANSTDPPVYDGAANIPELSSDSFSQQFSTTKDDFSDQNVCTGVADPLLSDLSSDVMAWPWLHENLFLQPDALAMWSQVDEQESCWNSESLDTGGVMNGETAQILLHLDKDQRDVCSPEITTSEPNCLPSLESDMWQPQVSSSRLTQPLNSDTSKLSRKLVDNVQQSNHGLIDQTRIVDEAVNQATQLGSLPDDKDQRADHWISLSTKIYEAFALQNEQPSGSPHALQMFIDLYLQHFGPLWPLLSCQGLDCDLLNPLLYLTLASIGAMYGGSQSAYFGTILHGRLRQILTTGLEFGEVVGDLIWLAQARLLTQVAALYFGQPQAFSYAQHLGGILVAQARRMNLFTAPRSWIGDRLSDSRRPPAERLAQWLYLEIRRRLAFGILRAETYTSVLLNTRPLVSPEEIDLELPCADSTWRGPDLPHDIFLALVEQDKASKPKQRFSDMVRIAFEKDETASVFEPQGLELILFGLQQSVWRFSHDHDVFLRLTGSEKPISQLVHDGLEHATVSTRSLNHLIPTSPAQLSIDQSPINEIEDHLGIPPRRMQGLQTDLDCLLTALQKMKQSLKFIRNSIQLQQDRTSVLTSLLLYHLSYVRLQAPLEDLHHVSYRISDKQSVEKCVIKDICEWANSKRAVIAMQHACIIWSLISQEVHRPGDTRAKFNFLSFTGLHHAAVVLWTGVGASSKLAGAQEVLSIEPLVESCSRIAVHRRNSQSILNLFSQLFDIIGPGRWSSFGAAALKLSHCQFPLPEQDIDV